MYFFPLKKSMNFLVKYAQWLEETVCCGVSAEEITSGASDAKTELLGFAFHLFYILAVWTLSKSLIFLHMRQEYKCYCWVLIKI